MVQEIIEDKIIQLKKENAKTAGEVLGRALNDDPISLYILPNDEERKENLKYIFRVATRIGIRYGEVYATSPSLEGIAIWMPCKRYKEKFSWLLRCGGFSAGIKVGLEAGKRSNPIRNFIEEVHGEIISEEHWYLNELGVDPTFQGKGYGSSLMRYMLKKIDEQGLPVYLETSLEKNVKYYEKFGFKIMKETLIPGTDVNMWFMLRDNSNAIKQNRLKF